MTGRSTKRVVNDTDRYCAVTGRCESEPQDQAAATPMRQGTLINTKDPAFGDRAPRWISAGRDASRASSLDGSLDHLLWDVDMTVLDWRDLGCITPTTGHENGTLAQSGDRTGSLDLCAVHQLGTILKCLSARSRMRRRAIN